MPARLSPLGACWQAQESLLPFDSVAALSLPATLVQLSFKSAEQNSGLNFLTKPPHSIVPKKRKKDHCHLSEVLQLATFNSHLKLKSISYLIFCAFQSKQFFWVGKGRMAHPNRHSSSMICSCSCTFLYLALTFSRPNLTVLMQGNLFGSQHRTASPESKRTDFFGVPADAGHSHFLTSCITSALCSQMSEAAP